MDAPIKIFLTNLGKYNEGELVGEWVDLPVDDDFEQAFADIGIGTEDEFGQPYEEWFITDYETEVGMDIGEYDDIYELNELAETLSSFDGYDLEVIKAYMENFNDNIDSAIDIVEDGDYSVYENCYDMGDVAEQIYSETGGFDRETLENYFDFEAFGRDVRYDMDDMAYDDWTYEHDGSDEGYESPYDGMSDYEVGEYYVYDMLGDISELGDDTLENYIDFDALGRDMSYESTFVFTNDGNCINFYR